MSNHGKKFTKIIEEEEKHAVEGNGQLRASVSPNKTPNLFQQMGMKRVVVVTKMAKFIFSQR